VAFGVSCKGFFQPPTMASFVISPTNPTVPYGGTQQMHAYGTDNTGQPMGDVTSQITWTSLAPGTISIGTAGTNPQTTPGLLTGVALSASTVEIDANYEALTQVTTNATVCVVNGTNFKVATVPTTPSVAEGATISFTASADATVDGSNLTGIDITAGVVWTSNNTSVFTIVNGTDPAIGTANATTSGTSMVTASYTCNGTTSTLPPTNVTVTTQ
jgi:hypothetical protein